MTRNVIQIRCAWTMLAVWLACDLIFSWIGLPWETTRTLQDRLGDIFTIAWFIGGLSIVCREKAELSTGKQPSPDAKGSG
jgi:hypothetical protein